MRTTIALTLLIVLALAMGCQGRPSIVQPGSLSSEPRSTASATAGTQAPDGDALSSSSSPPLPPEQFIEVPRLRDIHFEYDAHDIRPADASILEENAAWLKANPGTLVLIEGHTDERGTSEYNLGLGDLRASAAMRHLTAQGVPAAQMVAVSYGKERPRCAEHSEACWAQNRRAHFLAKPR